MTALREADPAMVPGGLQEVKVRELPGGERIVFEYAPAGYLTQQGERRQTDWRAYFWIPQPHCLTCDGSGRVPSEKRPDGTVKCASCNGGGECKRERKISVTTLLDAICPKGGLPRWAEARGIEGAVEAVRLGEIDAGTDPARGVEIVRTLKLGADRARDTAAERGLDVHSLLEQYMLTGDAPPRPANPAHWGYWQGLCRFLLKTDPEPESVEQLVCHPQAGYAGRRDLVAMVGGRRLGYDAKTQENGGIYSTAHLQLRMYEDAGVWCGDEPCDELRIVVFAANGEFREMLCEASSGTVARALAYYDVMKPIESLCTSANLAERKARAA